MFRSFGRNWFEYGQEGETFTIGRRSLNGNETNYMFRNDGAEGFREVAWALGTASRQDCRGTAIADFDQDGDLDIVLSTNNGRLEYRENRTPAAGWVAVRLRGDDCNSHGIGARVRVQVGGLDQVQEVASGSGYLSSPPAQVHFGLGAADGPARVEVRWPCGRVQTLEGAATGRVIVVEERGAAR
jgi:hypothetical protein